MKIGKLWQSEKSRNPVSREQFLEIYRQSVGPLYEYVSKRTGGNRTLAEDCVQETFLRAVRDWTRKGAPEYPEAWLKAVARNLLASHFRSIQPTSLDSVGHDPAGDDLRDEGPERVALVQWGLSRLQPKQAALLEEFHFEGRRVREMAQQRGITERALEGRLRRARHALRRTLRPLLQEGGTKEL